MIPPSIVLLFYGLVTDTSIHALFQAAFVPGFILSFSYIAYILIRTRIQPHLAPLPDPSEDDLSGSEKRMYGLALIAMIVGAGSLILLLRAIFFNALGEIDADTNYISVGFMVKSAALSIALFAFLALVVGRERTRAAWQNGKGMVAPLLIVFVSLAPFMAE